MLDWLAMGGYAGFVWPAYGIALVGLAIILVSALVAHARAAKALERAESSGSPDT